MVVVAAEVGSCQFTGYPVRVSAGDHQLLSALARDGLHRESRTGRGTGGLTTDLLEALIVDNGVDRATLGRAEGAEVGALELLGAGHLMLLIMLVFQPSGGCAVVRGTAACLGAPEGKFIKP